LDSITSLGYEIAKIHKAFRAKFQGVLTPFDVTVQQFEVLRTLNANPGITAAQLVERITSDSSTMMSILKRLESKALIERRPDRKDGRIKRIVMTEGGRDLMNVLADHIDGYNRRLLACCSAEDLQLFKQVLTKLWTLLQAGEGYDYREEDWI
jgi:DNA-binding MarR family transcriptional regulator